MPLAAEYRGFDARKDTINKGAFEGPWYTTLANLYGVSRREIEQREAKRRTTQRIQIFTAILLALVVFGAWSLYETHRSESLELATKSTQASTEGLYDRALRFAVLATRSPWLGRQVSESELSRAAYASPYVGLLNGHEYYVLAAAFSPDGAKVFTASKERTARLWDAVTGETLTTLTGHEGSVQAAAFSPDGTQVVTASDDTTARLWNVRWITQYHGRGRIDAVCREKLIWARRVTEADTKASPALNGRAGEDVCASQSLRFPIVKTLGFSW